MPLYQPLDETRQETRILLITNTEPLEFDFEYASMVDDRLEAFEAISWCWGDTSAVTQKKITVGKYTLSVPANAYEVLIELCVAQRKERIWIDAVCMNQNDNNEKSQQVAMMDTIYKKASKTVVWLGKDDGIANTALKMIEEISRWRQVRIPEVASSNMYKLVADESRSDPYPLKIDWDALTSFFSATWFTRIWIVQEVVLSRHVDLFMGRHDICWDLLAPITYYISHNQSKTKIAECGMLGVRNAAIIGMMDKGGMGPWVLLHSSPSFGATDPKDRIFALYGLLKTDTRAALRGAFFPDYDLRLVDIYTKATRAAMNYAIGPELLLRATVFVQRLDSEYCDKDFPSWVPRYHFVADKDRGSYQVLPHAQYYEEVGTEVKVLKIETDTPSNILRIAGVLKDTISSVLEPLSPSLFQEIQTPHESCGGVWCSKLPCSEGRAGLLEIISQLWHAAIAANPDLPLSEVATMFRTTLIGEPDQVICQSGCDCDIDLRHAFEKFVAQYWPTARDAPFESKALDGEEHVGLDDSDLDDEYSDDSDMEEETGQADAGDDPEIGPFWKKVIKQHVNRRFFLTTSGRIGIAAPQSQVGDKVCLLSGMTVPLVLRQVVNEWVLIGDAYLSVTMRSEQNDSEEVAKEQWFNLR